MKYISLISCLLISQAIWSQSESTPYQFEKTTIDLGEIIKGEKISGQYTFTNTGMENIEIELVSSCDCTEVKWTRKPITPGERGEISFVFDSSKKEVEETIDIDVYFKNLDPDSKEAYFEILNYTYRFKE